MKRVKNLEALFLATALMATFATYATADEPLRAAAAPVVASQAAAPAMQVVVIKGQRLSAAQKAAL